MLKWTVSSPKTYIVIILLISFALIGFLIRKDNQTRTETQVSQNPTPTGNINKEDKTTNPVVMEENTNELKIEDITVGAGDEAVNGKMVTVHYSGTLTNGTKFDSSYDRGVPFSFNLGAQEVIQGWDLGVAGMKVGGKRKLVIPSSLGYGATGAGGVIPSNATLLFEVELLKVE